MLKSVKSYRTLAIATLAYTLAVILWGAFVRVTGSGAGCGDHWPLCNGAVLPRSPTLETIIEFTHRFTSGILVALTAAWIFVAFRAFGKGHPARRLTIIVAVFLVIEALVGAGLVIFKMVVDNPSVARGWWTAAHLSNTFLLLGAITLATRAGWRDNAPSFRGPWARRCLTGLVLLVLAGASGAVAALGNTLFPAINLAAGLRMDFDPASHILVRLRVWHPVLALLAAGWAAGLSAALFSSESRPARFWAGVVGACAALQVLAGFVNFLLLAPAWMQLIHLLLGDCLWISAVMLLASRPSPEGQGRSA
ncbi:MAG TPA: COX15/CtaA family protein [Fibrobacteria bacterium]|jgi:cytochrome c oxidase assembly protein subunit 15|nr:COX15/CtaA family protein [Fibrobacteria bacterium]